MTQIKSVQIFLVGNPNAGKTSVFNRLTGLNQKIGNFPGVTVEKKEGRVALTDGSFCTLTDLPGTYSLHPKSPDERIVLQTICKLADKQQQNQSLIFYIADLLNLERHLLLLSQLKSLDLPIVLGLTMADLADDKGYILDKDKLSEALAMPVFLLNARNGDGLDAFKAWILNTRTDSLIKKTTLFETEKLAPDFILELKTLLGTDSAYFALLKAQHQDYFLDLSVEQQKGINDLFQKYGQTNLTLQIQETLGRFARLAPLVRSCLLPTKNAAQVGFSGRADQILTHKLWGTLCFFILLLLIFQATFDWATYPMDAIETAFGWFGEQVRGLGGESIWANFMVDGVLAGLAGIVVFIPQISILFCFIAILEEVGYMARAVYLSDNLMRRFGLNGRSIVSIFSGMACAVPAIMATRTISNWRERLITLLVTPFVSCSARIPVYTVLVAMVVPAQSKWGFFNAQGLILLGLYMLGIMTALLAAYILRFFVPVMDMSLLTMELPAYKPPVWANVGIMVWNKVKDFLWEAGRIILCIAVILWFLASFGPADSLEAAEKKIRAEFNLKPQTEEHLSDMNNAIASERLSASYIGRVGHFIEPAIRPLGFDWKIGIALLSSFAAREVFVGTMATIYAVGSNDDGSNIQTKMQKDVHSDTGEAVYTPVTSFGLMLFYAFAMQCMSTFAVVRRETNSWRYPIMQFVCMTALAYLSSLLVYTIWG